MSQKHLFSVQLRSVVGKKVQGLRKQGLVPANISGNLKHTIPVMVDQKKFGHLYKQVGDTGLVYLTVDGTKEEHPVLITEVQRDSLTDQVIHVVFRQVNLSEKVKAAVPVEVVGEFAVKEALLVTVHDEVEVEALPQDLPEKFVIDATQFTEVGQMVTFAQLQYDRSKVSLQVEPEQLETPVVMVQQVKEEVEPEPVVEAEAAEGTPAEGAAPEAAPAPEADKA